MSQERFCAKCRAPLTRDAAGMFCPKCSLTLALGSGESAEAASSSSYELQHSGILRRFGDYELLKVIARGGMGVVYKAWQISLSRPVAVKMILTEQLASEEAVQRFRTEANAVAQLQHPHIVAVHEFGQLDGQHFFSMDYVEGQNLAEVVGHTPLAAKLAANYLKTIAEAIHYAHQRNILHRDLKPSNVLMDNSGQPRITDFGLAKQLNADANLTLSGQVLGSPQFMPPEQAMGKRDQVGPHSDVYSLGAILYYLLTARPPFAAETIPATLEQVVKNEPVSPRVLNQTVPRDLETICLKCLQKDARQRFTTAQDLAEELGRFLRDQPILARPVSPAAKFWRWCRRHPAVAVPSVAAVMLSLVVVIGSPIAGCRINEARKAESHERGRAEKNAHEEARQRERAERVAAEFQIQRAEEFFAEDKASRALAHLARLLKENPTNRVAAERLLSAMTHRSFALPSCPLLKHSDVIHCTQFSPDGLRLVTASADKTARGWDARTGQ